MFIFQSRKDLRFHSYPGTLLPLPMDAYLLDNQLVNFMQQTLEGADGSFFFNNRDIATDFFGGPMFPQCAIDDAFGYPGNSTNN